MIRCDVSACGDRAIIEVRFTGRQCWWAYCRRHAFRRLRVCADCRATGKTTAMRGDRCGICGGYFAEWIDVQTWDPTAIEESRDI